MAVASVEPHTDPDRRNVPALPACRAISPGCNLCIALHLRCPAKMLDTVNVTPSKTSVALQSPKVAKGINKPVVPQSVEATVSYGCGLSLSLKGLLYTDKIS